MSIDSSKQKTGRFLAFHVLNNFSHEQDRYLVLNKCMYASSPAVCSSILFGNPCMLEDIKLVPPSESKFDTLVGKELKVTKHLIQHLTSCPHVCLTRAFEALINTPFSLDLTPLFNIRSPMTKIYIENDCQ